MYTLLVAALLSRPTDAAYKLANTVPLTDAAFLSIAPKYQGGADAVLATTFSAKTDSIAVIPNAAQVLAGGAGAATTLTNNVTWPNEAHQTPTGALPSSMSDYALIAGGFLVPGKGNGALSLLDLSNPSATPTDISVLKTGYFYHHAIWMDVDRDGVMDVVSARVNKPNIGKSIGELVWLKQPSPFKSGPWQEQVLFNGPDVNFIFQDVDGDGKEEVIATQFFENPGLWMYWCDGDTWLACATAKSVQSKAIDTSIGTTFAVVAADVNGDSKTDLLVTNNNKRNGGVFVYEVPAAPKTATSVWPKHTLKDGFKPLRAFLPGAGAPGNVAVGNTAIGNKPEVVVSGDDSGRLVVLTPSSTSPTDWTYTSTELHTAKGTTGAVFSTDLDNDGHKELLVAQYTEGTVQFFSSN